MNVQILTNRVHEEIHARNNRSLSMEWATTFTIDSEYFVKYAVNDKTCMIHGEYHGVSEIAQTHTVRVPKPVLMGSINNTKYAVYEFLRFSRRGNNNSGGGGRDLAAMHSHTSENGQFGWKMNNTIGATVQPNAWTQGWPEFWDSHRLGHMLDLAASCRNGRRFRDEERTRRTVYDILSEHECVPSLVHGDLWSGNQDFCDGQWVIYDPAVYYGDSEVDIAMSRLFGEFDREFYQAYYDVRPRRPGWQIREVVYNLYHVLNHCVLFGGGYWHRARSMMDEIQSQHSEET